MGNGPSLKKEYFSFFGGCSTLGMNAAYRYWEKIGFYPNIYCCLDDQVVLSHADAIVNMIQHRLCQHFFLHPNLLQQFPALANMQGVYFLPQMRQGEHNKDFCDKHGLDYLPQPLFSSLKPGKLTTGSYAVRFAAFLGYRQIGLVGVDCRYTEVIKEAKALDGIVLEIGTTPTLNTNYFFDDYQVKGDRYNIPNPGVHQGNLHLQAFEVLRDDIAQYKFDIEVSICSPESELYDRSTFPYVPLGDFAGGRGLSAVFVPFVRHDLGRLISALTRWGCQEFAPYRTAPSHPNIELHLAHNAHPDSALEERITEAYFRAGLSRYFSGLYFHYSKLDGLRDLYTRKFDGSYGPEGYMAGPNNQFFDIIEYFSAGMSHIVVIEADAIPIRANWLVVVEDIVLCSERFWICGSHYRGRGQIQSFSHINGNAIYNVGDHDFRQFFHEYFLPYFYKRVKSVPSLCYDIVLHDMFHPVFVGKADKALFRLWSQVAHRFRFSEYIVDVSHSADCEPETVLSLEKAKQSYSDAYLFHGAVAKIEAAPTTLYRKNNLSSVIAPSLFTSGVNVVMLDPDALGNYGHYLAYDDQLFKALKPYVNSFCVLANLKLPNSVAWSRGFFLPCLSDNSWTIGIPNGETQQVDLVALQRFENEVEGVLNSYVERNSSSNVCVYMYCAGIPHVQVILRLLERLPQISAVINLFYLPFQQIRSSSFRDQWVPVLRRLLAHERISLTLPTESLAHDLQAIYNINMSVTPHPSPTVSDNLFSAMQRGNFTSQGRSDSSFTVLFPGLPTQGKAPTTAIKTANMLASSHLSEKNLRVVMRDARKKEMPADLVALYDALHPAVETLKGQLSNDEFLNMFGGVDVVVLPYTPDMFKYRNSGLLVDAIYCGKPVVVLKGTWLAEIVEKTGCGIVVSSNSPELIMKAVSEISSDFEGFVCNAKNAARSYYVKNSWDKLARIIAHHEFAVVPASKTFMPPGKSQSSRQLLVVEPVSSSNLCNSVKSNNTNFLKFVFDKAFEQKSSTLWHYTPSEIEEQKLWIASFDVADGTQGREYLGGVVLKSEKTMEVQIILGCFGVTQPYEGASKTIQLVSGVAQCIQVRKDFFQNHPTLKIQLEVLSLNEDGPAELSIDSLYLTETLVSIRNRLTVDQVNLHVANRLFCEGDYGTAMGIYLMLHKQRSLSIYVDNALMCARRMGMSWETNVDDLLLRYE